MLSSVSTILILFSMLPKRTFSDGLSGCPCLTDVGTSLDLYKNKDGDLVYAGFDYPSDYGIGCANHDGGLPPYCDGSGDIPGWCAESFCYIDKNNCNLPLNYLSGYFPASGLYYSSQTCGNEGTFHDWFNDSGDDDQDRDLLDMADLIETYVLTIKNNLEEDFTELAQIKTACGFDSSCPCVECEDNTDWGESVNFATASLTTEGSVDLLDSTTCMAETLRSYYLKVVSNEYQDTTNVGFMYTGFEEDATLVQWPALDWCPSDYDPRFRPWYAGAVTNPKVLILVIDVSGSMQGARIQLAKRAAKAVLKTAGWKDKVGFVLFNSIVLNTRAPAFVTDDERDAMESWIDFFISAGGGTTFYEPIVEALQMIEDEGSGCSNVVLFLTDGQASFSESEFSSVQTKASASGSILFTYALGSGAETLITKRLACDNEGIFYNVEDDADLGRIMSSYYAYYAAAVKNTGVRWMSFDEAATGVEIIAACTPAYDNLDTTKVSVVFSVICIDITILAPISTMRSTAGWDSFYSRIESDSERCLPMWKGLGPGGTTQALEIIRTAEVSSGAEICGNVYVEDDDFYGNDDTTGSGNSTSGGENSGSGSNSNLVIIVAVVVASAVLVVALAAFVFLRKKSADPPSRIDRAFSANPSVGFGPPQPPVSSGYERAPPSPNMSGGSIAMSSYIPQAPPPAPIARVSIPGSNPYYQPQWNNGGYSDGYSAIPSATPVKPNTIEVSGTDVHVIQ